MFAFKNNNDFNQIKTELFWTFDHSVPNISNYAPIKKGCSAASTTQMQSYKS